MKRTPDRGSADAADPADVPDSASGDDVAPQAVRRSAVAAARAAVDRSLVNIVVQTSRETGARPRSLACTLPLRLGRCLLVAIVDVSVFVVVPGRRADRHGEPQ
jgi:hypothetical protein